MKTMYRQIYFNLIKGIGYCEVELFSDPDRITHIYQNLLNNAFYFTEEGSIHFGYEITQTNLEFFVEDSGCGIDESSRDLIFKPFFKGKNQIIGSKGFGLGLAISKGMVKLLGGDLQFISKPNEGSRFYFNISNSDIFSKQFSISLQNQVPIKMKAVTLNPTVNKLRQN